MVDESNDPYQATPCSSSSQKTLFPFKSVEQFEIETAVSSDQMTRWHKKGWLSFDPSSTSRFDEPHWVEVDFVKGIARSGLSDEWIDTLLSKLRAPYCYDSKRTFYSFAEQSWKTVPTIPEPEEVTEEIVDEYLQDLAEAEELDALLGMRETIDDLLENRPQSQD